MSGPGVAVAVGAGARPATISGRRGRRGPRRPSQCAGGAGGTASVRRHRRMARTSCAGDPLVVSSRSSSPPAGSPATAKRACSRARNSGSPWARRRASANGTERVTKRGAASAGRASRDRAPLGRVAEGALHRLDAEGEERGGQRRRRPAGLRPGDGIRLRAMIEHLVQQVEIDHRGPLPQVTEGLAQRPGEGALAAGDGAVEHDQLVRRQSPHRTRERRRARPAETDPNRLSPRRTRRRASRPGRPPARRRAPARPPPGRGG